MEQFDIEKQTSELQSSALKAIKGLFPVKTKTGSLRLADVWVDDRLDPGDIQSQLKAKNSDRTWGVPIYGTFELLDEKGKVSQRKDKVRLVTLPKLTPRMSYIINGAETQVTSQLRLRPAGYTVRTGPGGIKGQINLSKGYSGQIELHMKPETGVMRTKVGQANQRLYPILNALGMSDSEMAKRWGQDVLDANKNVSKSDYDSAVKSFAKSLIKKDYADTENAARDLRKFVLGTEMDPKINQRTLGKPHKNLSAEFLADLGGHVLKTVQGETEPHDRNALEYKEYTKLTDLIEERLSLPEFKNKITRKIQYNIAGKDKLEDMIHSSVIGPDIKAVFNLPELSQSPDQLNPIDMWNTASRVTIMGPGGIKSEHQVTDDMRDVHPSHLGFLDPIHTPESGNVGIVYHLPFTATSKDKTLLTRAINLKTNKMERLDPARFADSVVAFPGQYDRKSKKWKDPKGVVVLGEGNKTKRVSASQVDYTLESPKQVFSIASNSIPFLETNSGSRALVASKMSEQAVPLKERESPLVQAKVGGEVTFEDLIGDAFISRSPVDGVVSKVSDDSLSIRGTDGNLRKIQLYNNFPLNTKSFIDSDLKVKKGDIVSQDQIISDTNFTKDGSMALGRNLVTAYMPYKGYNFEDGIVITDTAAKKLTSEHLHTESAQASDRFDINKRRFVANYPNVYSKSQVEKLDSDGVVKKGTVVQPGDPIIARLRKDEIDPENLVLGKLSRALIRPWKDDSISWHGDMPGVVTDVVRHGNKMKVYIKTEEPATIGDKLVGRYGNKGVVGLIIPEGEAPRTKDGTPADIILNPHGIITRINVGQVLENSASKVAEKTGKTYVTDNFSEKNSTKEVQNALKKHGLSDLEELEDPVTGKSLGKVNVGKTYIMKLKKQVRSQFSARGAGPGWRYSQHTHEPVKGGEAGSKSMDLLTFYSMLGHGARSNLREMGTYKATRNDDFWNALKTGSILPAPKPTFAYNKFLSYMKGAGVDIKQEGSKLTLAPMTDREVDNISNGAIQDPLFVRAKDLEEKPGGLMDKKITGGLRGEKWSHIDLEEPIVNPVFEQPVRALLDMNKTTYSGLMEGRLFVDEEGNYNEEGSGLTGGAAMEKLLSQVDKKMRLKEFTDAAKKAKAPAALNKANHGIRYIEALNKFKLEPKDAYILRKVPVLPPVYRPIYALPDGNLHTSPVNYLYRDLGLANQKLKFMNSLEYMPEDAKQDLRKDIYKGTAAVQGLANPITFYPKSRPVRGIIEEIKGVHGQGSKTGFFQKHVLRREQDLVGRGAIIPEPKLGVDEVGLPEEMAWTIFRPFIIRDLIGQGYKGVDADKEVDDRSFIAKKALEAAMNDRPVLLNRAPSLHKFSIMAFKPKIMTGRAIKIPNLIVKGFNADYNGDSISPRNYIVFRFSGNGNVQCERIEDLFKTVTGKTTEEMVADANGHTAVYEISPGKLQTQSIHNDKLIWADIAQLTVHTSHEDCYRITTHTGTEIIATEHHNFSYMNENLDLDCVKTEDLPIGCMIPKSPLEYEGKDFTLQIGLKTVKLDEDFSWLLGFYAGDGSVSDECVSFCDTEEEIFNYIGNVIEKKLDERTSPQGTKQNSRCIWRTYKKYIAKWFERECGKGYDGKRVPGFIFASKASCRHAYIAGLFQAEGSISPDSNGNYVARIEMKNRDYILQLRILMSSVGIGTYISTTKKDTTVLNIRKHSYRNLKLSRGIKYEILKKALHKVGVNIKKDKFDIVPISNGVIEDLRAIGKSMRNLSKEERNALDKWRESHHGRTININDHFKRQKNFISLHIVSDIINTYGMFKTERMEKWIKSVFRDDIMWEQVKSVEKIQRENVMFDLSVPEGEMFVTENGLLTHNTMHVHVPIMPKAVNEARGMVPSKHLFNPGTGNIMVAPSQEAAIGLYFLTKEGKSIKKSFGAVGPLQKAIENKEVGISDMVTLAGRRTSAGRAMVDAVLPKKYQGRDQVLNKKGITSLLTEIAQNDPQDYAKTVHSLAELGNEHSYQRGFTVSLDDISPDIPEKDALFADAKKKAKGLSDQAVIKLYTDVDEQAKKLIAKNLGSTNNSLYEMVRSGARGNMNQLKQIVSAPVLFEGAGGDTLPIPVTGSFSEGLNMSEYWNSMYGNRRGSVDGKLQTAKPGEFNKDLMSTTVKNIIASEDCGTGQGVDFSIDDEDAQDRVLTSDIKVGSSVVAKSGDIITSNMISKLRSGNVKKIKARSPLSCELPKGTCAKCYGLDTDGRLHAIGDNIGAIAGQSLTEPLTQMVLRARHHGGVAGGQQLTGYEKIDKLVHMPKTIVGKATLAERGGKVSAMEKSPAGGQNIFIDDVKHFISPGNRPKVRTGERVQKGDPLSDGIIHPRDLVRLKGMKSAQNYLVDEISSAYKDTGVNLKRKNVEAVVRSIADTTRVLDGGDSPWVFGDVVSYNEAEAFNRSALGKIPIAQAEGKPLFKDHGPVKAGTKVGKRVSKILEGLGYNDVSVGPDPIAHEPFLDGIKQLPMMSKDWMAQMGYGHLVRGIKSGAGEAWTTDIHDYSPIPAFAYGAEFGMGQKGKY